PRPRRPLQPRPRARPARRRGPARRRAAARRRPAGRPRQQPVRRSTRPAHRGRRPRRQRRAPAPGRRVRRGRVLPARSGRRVLVVRTDSDGDVLLAGPAVRAVAAHARVTMLVAPEGAQAARLLPGVDDVIVFAAPWSGYWPPPVDADATAALVERVRAKGFA